MGRKESNQTNKKLVQPSFHVFCCPNLMFQIRGVNISYGLHQCYFAKQISGIQLDSNFLDILIKQSKSCLDIWKIARSLGQCSHSLPNWNRKKIGITHVFSWINICWFPRKVFEHEANRPSAQKSPKGPGKC